MKAREIGLIGLLLSLSLVLQISPLKVPTQWGMTIDLVAVPIVVIYILLGFWSSITALFLLFLGLSLVSPASWLGASMKFFATLGVLIGLEIAKRITRFDFKNYKKERDLVIFVLVAYLIGIAIRIPAMVAMNYYYALPLWLGIPREQVIPTIEEWFHIPFWLVIGIPNAIQSAVDVVIGVLVSLPVVRALPHIIE
ncbi:MAG: riboflavin transporter [Thermococcaceae archaeon]|nr:riboflavin transporter [Thermococcaceae archaeon]